MTRCRFCHKPIPPGVSRCPYCYASLESYKRPDGERLSPYEARLGTRKNRKPNTGDGRSGRSAIGRFIFGCLVICLVVLAGVLLFAIMAPDRVRVLMLGTPSPMPIAPRPTLTPSPVPTATPEWKQYTGGEGHFSVEFPPYWVVIDFGSPTWEKVYRFESLRYSWLAPLCPEEKIQEMVEGKILIAFDARRMGSSSFSCRSIPELGGMTAEDCRDNLGDRIITRSESMEGKIQGGVRKEIIEVGDRPAVSFEAVLIPAADSLVSVPIVLGSYVVVGSQAGYWIDVQSLSKDYEIDKNELMFILDRMHFFD